MGCSSPREKIENQMMVYKLERLNIQMEKEKEIKKLEEIQGHVVERTKVPDYIDPVFAKEKRIIVESNDIDNSKSIKKNDNNKDKDKNNSENSPKKKRKKG